MIYDNTGVLVVYDLMPIINMALSDKTKEALSHKTHNSINEYIVPPHPIVNVANVLKDMNMKNSKEFYENNCLGERRISMVRFFGVTSYIKDEMQSLTLLIDMLNDLGDKGYIQACLSTPNKVPMARINPFKEEAAYVCYIALTDDGDKYAAQTYADLMFNEGNAPKRLEDIK